MRDFKYRNLVSGDDVWEPLMKRILEVRSKCLAGCTQAFQANMKRSAAFAVMPAAIAFQVRRDTMYLVNALCSVTSKNQITLDEILSVSSVAPSSEVKARIGLQIEQF